MLCQGLTEEDGRRRDEPERGYDVSAQRTVARVCARVLDLQSEEIENYVVCWGDDLCHVVLKAREAGVWQV